jgi:hypothetical protein
MRTTAEAVSVAIKVILVGREHFIRAEEGCRAFPMNVFNWGQASEQLENGRKGSFGEFVAWQGCVFK